MKRFRTKCPRCFKTKFWKLSDNRLKCFSCRDVFTPRKLVNSQLKQIISEFILEHSTNVILSRVNISKYKLLKILTLLRIVMSNDIPEVFSGTVEVDETYLGAKMKNRRLKELLKIKARFPKQKKLSGHATIKQPIFGILCRSGKVWAEIVPDVEAKDLQPLIVKQVKRGSTVCSDTWRGYTGLATKGYVHRLVKHSEGEYSDKQGNHINGLEGFWGYLKRKLAAKGGIRKLKLYLYLAEYVWRYNHRQLNFKKQQEILLKLTKNHLSQINRLNWYEN